MFTLFYMIFCISSGEEHKLELLSNSRQTVPKHCNLNKTIFRGLVLQDFFVLLC